MRQEHPDRAGREEKPRVPPRAHQRLKVAVFRGGHIEIGIIERNWRGEWSGRCLADRSVANADTPEECTDKLNGR